MNQQQRMELVDQIVANTPGTEQSKLELRRELYRWPNEDLQKVADRYGQICAESERKRRHQLEEAERRDRELHENLAFTHIFRTPINGRGVLVVNEANRNFLRLQVDEIRGDQLGP